VKYISDIQFAEKQWLWLLVLIPLLTAFYIIRRRKREGEFNYPTFLFFKKVSPPFRARMRHSLFVLRMGAFATIIVALARPQSRSSWRDVKTEGIDIMFSLDISLSMLAKDFKPNRIEVAKEVILDFIDDRPDDRIGMVIFGGQAFTQCPLTSDHTVLKNMFSQIRAGALDQGTAIGLGLATAAARIKDSKSKSKVIILVSDGVSNVGEVSPLTAGEIARNYGIRVYCIGVGSRGKALQPVAQYAPGEYEYDYVDVEIDEKVMGQIADMTEGKYFRATDKASLQGVYEEIDKMEKTIISEKSFSNKAEHFFPYALAAAILLSLEFLLRFTYFRIFP
jgi:Ca-activated chloride channel family protein